MTIAIAPIQPTSLQIELTDEEILADLLYPEALPRGLGAEAHP